MLNISICLSDIPAEARKKSEKNGKYYANFTVSELKNTDDYGNTHSVSISRSKEEREAKKPIIYIGKGKEFKFNNSQQQQTTTPTVDYQKSDDLPF